MKSNFSFGKVLTLTLMAFALIFSACQNPIGSDLPKGASVERAAASADLRLPNQNPPGGLLVEEVPMFVSFGWDDNGKEDGMNWILDVADTKTNPLGTGNAATYDGESVSMSFYQCTYYIKGYKAAVKASWKRALDAGHELGNHSDSHPHGKAYSVDQWNNEINAANDWLTKPYDPTGQDQNSGIGMTMDQIHGFRTPYLEYGDNLLKALYSRGWYDCSIEEGFEYDQDGTNHFWPFTLDNGAPGHDIQVEWGSKDPISKHPGMWEMPVYVFTVPPQYRDAMKSRVSWFDPVGGKITGFDYNLWTSFSMNKTEFLDTLKHSFDLKMNGNRAPMLIGVHTDYYVPSYSTPAASYTERRAAIEEFIDYALSFKDTRMVSYKKVLDWVKNPVKLNPLSQRFAMNVSTNGGGTVSPAGNMEAAEGSDKTFTFTPSFGAKVESIVVNGVLQPYTANSYTFTNISTANTLVVNFVGIDPDVDPGEIKTTTLSLVSIAENSNPFLVWNYAENINDGRGITFGICGFTSGTYDGTYVIKALNRIDPTHPLVSYLPAFQAIDALPHDSEWKNDSTVGLENFIADFNKHGEDKTVMQAQIEVLHDKYWNPAQEKALELGLTLPISMAFTYDTCVNHGASGDGADKGLEQLAAEAAAASGGTPAEGVNEITFLNNFLDARDAYLATNATWEGARDRIQMYKKILAAGNEKLPLPLAAECYLDQFLITGTEIDLSLETTFHSINVTVGAGGYVVPYNTVRVPHGSIPFFGISADEGNEIKDVLVDGVSVGPVTSYQFTSVTADHTVEAVFGTFIPSPVTVNVTSGLNGTSDKEGTNEIMKGDDFVITCTPDADYKVAAVTANGASVPFVGNVITLNYVTADVTDVQIAYEYDPRPKADVTITSGPNGSATPEGVVKVVIGNSLTVNFSPNAGYRVLDAKIDGVSQGKVDSVTLTNVQVAQSVHVDFEIVPDCPYPEYVHGDVYTGGMTVHHNGADYRAKWWTQWEEPPGSSGVWEWLQDCGTVTTKYDVTATAGANGSISPAGTQNVAEGTVVDYVIAADAGYQIDDVTVNGVSQGAVSSLSVTVNATTTVAATFKLLPVVDYTITATAGANGTITPSGSQIVQAGTVVDYVIAANAGYIISDVTVDGVSKGAVSTLSVTVLADTAVAASFELEPVLLDFTITASAGLNGSISPAGATVVKQGSDLAYTITADAGFAINDVLVDGVSVGSVASYTFTNVQKDATISVTFVEQTVQPWSPDGVAYKLDDEVSYNGAIYVCKYAHTSNSAWVPGTPGLWLWELK